MILDSSFNRPNILQIKNFANFEAINQKSKNDKASSSSNKTPDAFSINTDVTSTSVPSSSASAGSSDAEKLKNLEKSLMETALIDYQTTLNHYNSISNNGRSSAAFSDRIKSIESIIESYRDQISNEVKTKLKSSPTDFTA